MWSDDELLSDYLRKFEGAREMKNIPRYSWGTHLSLYVTSKSQSALNIIREELLHD